MPRWRPAGTAEFNKTRNVLIASNAAGVVQHWHVTSGKLLHTTRSPEKNQIFCVDYRADGSAFAAAGAWGAGVGGGRLGGWEDRRASGLPLT